MWLAVGEKEAMIEEASYAQWVGSVLGEYRLTRMLGAGPLGPLYAADSVRSSTPFLVRVLTVPPAQTPDMLQTYQTYLERQAGHILTLRHPYMLPLVSYGMYQGLPYFVWPYTTMRSLSTRLSQSGVLDVVTAGRYLDQIAATLEYAHQNATFHRNLSLDCIYLQMDGQIAVADFGVRRLYELLTPGSQSRFFSGSAEACAPEQLLGGQIGSYTDVYALGGSVYRMLTGHPVFHGESFRALAEQHLQAPPPSLAQARIGLPAALDRVLAGALAKDPAQRIQHPGELADAYHQVIAPANSRRVPFSATIGSGGSGGAGGASPAQGQVSSVRPGSVAVSANDRGASTSRVAVPSESLEPASASGGRQFFARSWWFFLLILVLIPLVSGGIFFLANNHTAAPTVSGTLLFVDSASPPDGANDGLRITANGLAAAAAGSQYQVWLINQKTEQITSLGRLVAAADGKSYQLVYASPGANAAPANILSEGDMVEVTEEHASVVAPAGRVVLLVKFPPDAFTHIKHLLLSFPTTPGKIGLLVGVLQQTQLLNEQASALNQASGKGQPILVQCLAQSVLDISEGKNGAHYKPLGSACAALGVTEAGDGFGLLSPPKGGSYGAESGTPGYIKNAADHASLAVATPDATDALRQHAGPVQTTLADVTKSVTAADNAALTLLKTPEDGAAVKALVAASAAAYKGSGASGNGGAIAAYQQGQLMATLSLVKPAP